MFRQVGQTFIVVGTKIRLETKVFKALVFTIVQFLRGGAWLVGILLALANENPYQVTRWDSPTGKPEPGTGTGNRERETAHRETGTPEPRNGTGTK